MRLGFDATTLVGRMSGVGYYTKRLLEGLADGTGEGVLDEVLVLSNRPVDLPPGARVRQCSEGRFPVRSVWMQLLLPGLLRKKRPDLVHFTNYLAPLRSPVPYVVSVHDMTLSLFPEYHTLKKRLLTASLIPAVTRRARLVLAPSESTRRDIHRLLAIPPERVKVVPYAPSPAFRPSAESPDVLAQRYGVRQPYFLYVGTLEPRKNLAGALRAFARVADRLPDHQFVLAGQRGWSCDDVFEEAARPALAGRVLFLDYVAEGDLPLLYTHAAAAVYPSLYEGFGFPVLEAMACGTPVLTSRSSSLEEIGQGAALLVDPRDEGALADALASLGEDGALRGDLSVRGLERAAEFTWERTVRGTLAAYEEALAGPGTRGE
jgi:glycosyltransferase involved in cell wall biosynthesis